MNGLAITAGSKPILFANTGNKQPTSFEAIIVTSKVKLTTKLIIAASLKFEAVMLFKINQSIKIILVKVVTASVTPHSKETRNSLKRILNCNK